MLRLDLAEAVRTEFALSRDNSDLPRWIRAGGSAMCLTALFERTVDSQVLRVHNLVRSGPENPVAK